MTEDEAGRIQGSSADTTADPVVRVREAVARAREAVSDSQDQFEPLLDNNDPDPGSDLDDVMVRVRKARRRIQNESAWSSDEPDADDRGFAR